MNFFGRRMLLARLLVGLVVLLSAKALMAAVDDDSSAADVEAKLAAALTDYFGQPISIDAIKPSPASGIIEMQITNGPMLYATEGGEYFFFRGELHGFRDGSVVNVTEAGRAAERLDMLEAINVDDTIVFSPKGETKDHILVFTDISCGYCRKLHSEVDQLNDYGIEVRYLAYPRAGVGSEDALKLETAWCADNPQETLTALKAGAILPNVSCNSDLIAAQYALGGDLGVRGTPAIFTSDGILIPGYQPAENLAKMLGLLD